MIEGASSVAWIESHTEIERHRKVILMSDELGIKPVHLSGHLHALWHNVLEQQEDGNLSHWSPQIISRMALFDGDAENFVSLLKKYCFIDAHTNVVHDWLDYAGKYLWRKYHSSNPAKLRAIERIHKVTLRSPKVLPQGSTLGYKKVTTRGLVGRLVGSSSSSLKGDGLEGEEEKYETPKSAKWKRDRELDGIRRECENSAGEHIHTQLLRTTRETIKASRETVQASRAARLARLEALHVTRDQWRGFEEMREKIHKPMTERAEDMAVHKLEQLAADGENAGDCLDQSTFHNWQGIYRLKVINGGRNDEPNERIQRILKRGL